MNSFQLTLRYSISFYIEMLPVTRARHFAIDFGHSHDPPRRYWFQTSKSSRRGLLLLPREGESEWEKESHYAFLQIFEAIVRRIFETYHPSDRCTISCINPVWRWCKERETKLPTLNSSKIRINYIVRWGEYNISYQLSMLSVCVYTRQPLRRQSSAVGGFRRKTPDPLPIPLPA